jgi:hypothetical protein
MGRWPFDLKKVYVNYMGTIHILIHMNMWSVCAAHLIINTGWSRRLWTYQSIE